MKKQIFKVTKDGCEYRIGYSYSPISGKTKLSVDNDEFTVSGKPFYIGVSRREMIIIGSSQGILDIDKKGRAKIICKDADSIEEKTLIKEKSTK